MNETLPYDARITHRPGLMGGASHEEILREYPDIESDDILAVLSYAAWRVQE